ncbi:hypothetical protein N867_15595 [Actinotalea fermentans ATCC 43279 = JCM 9966 = DSM 3133]|nr:hypothetical protein N867_15595 [Actinotalea fermentans ATCC 43279 = JCM 9966 = DSM 3133]
MTPACSPCPPGGQRIAGDLRLPYGRPRDRHRARPVPDARAPGRPARPPRDRRRAARARRGARRRSVRGRLRRPRARRRRPGDGRGGARRRSLLPLHTRRAGRVRPRVGACRRSLTPPTMHP